MCVFDDYNYCDKVVFRLFIGTTFYRAITADIKVTTHADNLIKFDSLHLKAVNGIRRI